MSEQPAAKRHLRPAAPLPTTAETYGVRHGLAPELTLALENIGRNKRQVVAQGRSFVRSQTTSVLPNPHLALPAWSGPGDTPKDIPKPTWQSENDTLEHARAVLRESGRPNELQPFYATILEDDKPVSPFQTAPLRPEEQLRPTKRKDLEVGLVDAEQGHPGVDLKSVEREGTEAEDMEMGMHQSTDKLGVRQDDFPPVFVSPKITQPELFAKPIFPRAPGPGSGSGFREGVPGGTGGPGAQREKKGLPSRMMGRQLGKTVSAPVFGAWGGMEVDGGEVEGDGFDVGEWAKGEDF
ncbi:hypothetical protein M231_07525 [Tremella mesenterica]|uniref:Uncharacterized protein n=1 Tax=Tremella mesenterica TaxID=5217 RepID=A0A4Q1B963_TREME|nr:uncharacterized protein TREMEDRAFT_65706 [Tremella mesenterica DSM 1558]EIW66417.1 hypothetical protein TREMEDRAFT_65706 [Tremella mesenterica DSM 1558]RXK35222.1 hypothetical protein M231_07525 [Tremella mesenterica]